MKKIIFITLLFLSKMIYSQNDLQVTLHENTLNKLFSELVNSMVVVSMKCYSQKILTLGILKT